LAYGPGSFELVEILDGERIEFVDRLDIVAE